MRYGYHLVTDCRKANQGNKSHKDVEATIIHHSNTYTRITATKAKPFQDGKHADILLSNITTIDNPAARNLYLDVTSTNPMGVTNQEFINRAALNHQPGPGDHLAWFACRPSSSSLSAARHRRWSCSLS